MKIFNECILIISGEKDCGFSLVQSIVSHESTGIFEPVSFIQFISSTHNDDLFIKKFALNYTPCSVYPMKSILIEFDRQYSGTAQVKQNNTTVDSENFTCSTIRIIPDNDNKNLDLVFESHAEKTDENNKTEDTVNKSDEELSDTLDRNKILKDETEKNCTLLETAMEENKKLEDNNKDIIKRIQDIREKTESLRQVIDEYENAVNMKKTLEQNIEENQINLQNTQELLCQLSCYRNIMKYYKNDNRYIAVSEKLSETQRQVRQITDDISELAQVRAGMLKEEAN